jgi:hypothetical protein
MKKHFSATKYLPIALARAAFTASDTASAFAQQSGWGAGISTRNGAPLHKLSTNRSGYSSYARITHYSAIVPDMGTRLTKPRIFAATRVHVAIT